MEAEELGRPSLTRFMTSGVGIMDTVSSYKLQAKAASFKQQAASPKQLVSSLKPQATSSRILEPENVL